MLGAAVPKDWFRSPFGHRITYRICLEESSNEIYVDKGHDVKMNRVMLECHLVLFKQFVSSELHSRATSKWKDRSAILGREGQGRKRKDVAVEWYGCTKLWGQQKGKAGKERKGKGLCRHRALLVMMQWVHRPTTGAASPLHRHVHQVTRLDVTRDVPFAALMPLFSVSCVWQGGSL